MIGSLIVASIYSRQQRFSMRKIMMLALPVRVTMTLLKKRHDRLLAAPV
jgi:hypothetical protein